MKMPPKVLLFAGATTLVIGFWAHYLWRLRQMPYEYRITGRLASGIEVDACNLPKEQREILRFFDAYGARITLDHIPTDKPLWIWLELRRRGKPALRSAALIIEASSSAHKELTTCIAPIGAQITDSDKIKILFEEPGLSYMPFVIDNPFKGYMARSMGPTIPADKDGVQLIAGANRNQVMNPMPDPDAEVRLMIRTGTPAVNVSQTATPTK